MMQYTDHKQQNRRQAQKGLTLFELLVVLAILTLLATLIAPRVIGYLGRAKADVARAQAANIAASLELYYIDFDRYPNDQEGLAALVTAPASPDAQFWRGPYFKEETGLIDPWGRPYIYEIEIGSDAFTVISLGRDGAEGGEGDDSDIRRR